MKKTLIVQLLLLVTQSCSSTFIPREIKQNFEICYTGKDTDIESYIDINGYYTMCSGNIPINMIFFKDGIFAWQVFLDKKKLKSDTCVNLIQEVMVSYKNKSIINGTMGMYWIEGNTIKTRCVAQVGLLTSTFGFYERWYKIIDRQTLQYIYSKPLLNSNAYTVKTIEEWQKNNKYSTAKFYCADSIPSSDCWLKEQKWFWCNEQDWKDYMKRKKQKKKKK